MFKTWMSLVPLFLAGSVWAQEGKPAARQSGPLPLSIPSAVTVATTATAPDLLAAQLTDTAFAVPRSEKGCFKSTLKIGDGKPEDYCRNCPARECRTQSSMASRALASAAQAVMAKPECFNLPNDGCLRLPYTHVLEQPLDKVVYSDQGWVNFDNYVSSISSLRPVMAKWGRSKENFICTADEPFIKNAVFFLGHLGQEVVLTLDGGAGLKGRISQLKSTGALCVSLTRPGEAELSSSNPEPIHALNHSCQNKCDYTLQAWDENKRLRLAIKGSLSPVVDTPGLARNQWWVSASGLAGLLLVFPILSAVITMRFPGVRRALRVSPPQELQNAMAVVWARARTTENERWQFQGPYSLARLSVFIWTLLTVELLIAHVWLIGEFSLTSATTTAALMGIQLINVALGAPAEEAQRKKWLEDYEVWNAGVKDEAVTESLKGRARNLWFGTSLIGDLLYKSPAANEQIVVSRLQMIVFSLCIYVWIVMEYCASGAVPPLSDSLLALVGVSSGAYMGFKLTQVN